MKRGSKHQGKQFSLASVPAFFQHKRNLLVVAALIILIPLSIYFLYTNNFSLFSRAASSCTGVKDGTYYSGCSMQSGVCCGGKAICGSTKCPTTTTTPKVTTGSSCSPNGAKKDYGMGSTFICCSGKWYSGTKCPAQKYSCRGGLCVADSSGSYTTSNCDGKCGTVPKKYSCRGGLCVEDSNGTYTNSSCGGKCSAGTKTTTTPKVTTTTTCQTSVSNADALTVKTTTNGKTTTTSLGCSAAKINSTQKCTNGTYYCCKGGTDFKWQTSACSKTTVAATTPAASSKTAGSSPKTGGGGASSGGDKSTGDTDKGCNDQNCANILENGNYAIVNCATDDSNGDYQLCTEKGRIGICQGKQYCCPGAGQQWTTDMTACPTTVPSLTVSEQQSPVGGMITVTWANITTPSQYDWFGLYIQGEEGSQLYQDWAYVHSTSGTCTRIPGDGSTQGTCTYTLPDTVVPGIYELRLFSNNQYTQLAVSNPFTIVDLFATQGLCVCESPTPTPYYQTSNCNGPCMTSQNCANGQVCILAEGVGWACRNPACVLNSTCNCASATPTPTTRAGRSCGEWCASSSDCRSGLSCIGQGTDTLTCKNPSCPDSTSCSCVTPTKTPTPTSSVKGGTVSPTLSAATTATASSGSMALKLNALPTPTPTPAGPVVNPPLTINPFSDKSGQTNQTFTLSGVTDPLLEVDIRIDPDGFGHTTTADAKGDWRLILTKALTPGQKQLTVTARTNEGGRTEEKMTFTVKRSNPFFGLFIGFFVLAALGGIGYFIYQKQMNDQSALFTNYPSITPLDEEKKEPEVEPETPKDIQ